MEKKETILIVDDNTNNLQVLGTLLRDNEYKISLAKDGMSALRVLQNVRPNLILLDIMMPGMDGYTLCTEIKKQDHLSDIPIIFITAKIENEDILRGYEMGAVDYILKPFDKNVLLARVQNHLEIARSRKIIEEQKNKLEDMVAMRDKMFSIIAHDLRGPISNLKMYYDLSKQMPEAIEINDMLDIVGKSSESAFDLLNNLLHWARLQCDNQSVKPETLNLHRVIDEKAIHFGLNLNAKGIKILNSVHADFTITADSTMIQTVLRNLIANAIKFTPQKGQIEIGASKEKGRITFWVKDSGIGLSQEAISKILNPNEIYTTYGTNNEKGSGIGLQLCIDFLAAADGSLSIESEEGKGTTFFVEIPDAL